MDPPRPTVILADDHPMVLDGLAGLLEGDFDVIDRVADGEALVATATRRCPELVIADISMPRLDGIEATQQLTVRCPTTRVLILSFYGDAARVRAAFGAGAWAFVGKSAAGDEIVRAIREVLDGRFYISPNVARQLAARDQPVLPARRPDVSSALAALTRRELDVVRLVGEGRSNKTISATLGISVTTVRTHLSSIYAKLNTSRRVELALIAADSDVAVPAQ